MYQIEKDGITKSLLTCYMQCHRKFELRTAGYGFIPSLSVLLGKYGHKMIEVQRIKGKLVHPYVEEGKSVAAVILPVLDIIIPAYFKYWGEIESAVKHKPEVVFDVMKSEIRLRGKIDDFINGDTVLDTKFKSRMDDNDITNHLPLSMDGLFYCTAMGVPSFIIDAVRYPPMKEGRITDVEKLTKEVQNNPQEYFKRFSVEYSAEDLKNFEEDLIAAVNNIYEGKAHRSLSSCWNCEFVNCCATGSKEGLHTQPLFSELEE